MTKSEVREYAQHLAECVGSRKDRFPGIKGMIIQRLPVREADGKETSATILNTAGVVKREDESLSEALANDSMDTCLMVADLIKCYNSEVADKVIKHQIKDAGVPLEMIPPEWIVEATSKLRVLMMEVVIDFFKEFADQLKKDAETGRAHVEMEMVDLKASEKASEMVEEILKKMNIKKG
jgi:hypothetical protein